MICQWKYYQYYISLTLFLPLLETHQTGNVYTLENSLSGFLIRQSRDLTFKPFNTMTPLNFSAPHQISIEELKKMNQNTGFSSSTSTAQAQRIDTKNPRLDLGTSLSVAIDINGPLGEVGSSFKGSQNTGAATSQAGALTGTKKGSKGPANAQTAAQANILVDDPNAEASASVLNTANVIMSGNAKGNAQSAGSVNTKSPDGTITTAAPPAAAPPKLAALESPKKLATVETTQKPITVARTTSTTTTTTSTTTTTTSTTTTPLPPLPLMNTDTQGTDAPAEGGTDADTTTVANSDQPTEIGGGGSDESEDQDERPHRGRHRRPPPPPRRPMHGGFSRGQQFGINRFVGQQPNRGYFQTGPNFPTQSGYSG
ncbi:uncharacterized protein LOC129592572 [Paramacrobiotus metropolitanus]|uniref:uncharacterized protein LOC129592572 n=1 Tax=Paramacrobiotus metropolitanus TaxID=2943436 RepID=UPI002446397B|nr:uncharacterized protein LOC129592572 [Paramacrobiotus metropolitanus]